MGRLLSSIGATHTTARRRRACTHVQGRRRISRDSQTVRIGGQIIIRSHNRACPFLLLAFSPFLPRTMRISTLHLWFIAISISLSLSLSARKCLHGTPTWTRTFVLLVSRTLSFLSSNRPPRSQNPRFLGGRACIKIDYSGSSRGGGSISLFLSIDSLGWGKTTWIRPSLGLLY